MIQTIHDPNVQSSNFILYAISFLNNSYQNIDWNINKYNISGIGGNDISKCKNAVNEINIFTNINFFDMIKNIDYNKIKYNNFIKNTYDIILTETINSINNFDKKYNKFEITRDLLFIKKTLELLNINGKYGIIISSEILISLKKKHISIRKYLVENYNLEMIVSIDNTLLTNKNDLSILFFTNTGKTNDIIINTIKLDSNNIFSEYNDYVLNSVKYLSNYYQLLYKIDNLSLEGLSLNNECDMSIPL